VEIKAIMPEIAHKEELITPIIMVITIVHKQDIDPADL
jgi:hypothetical protein